MKTSLGVLAALACVYVVSPALALDKVQCVAAAEHGQALRKQRKLVSARAELGVCAVSACPAVVAIDCARWLDDVERRIVYVTIEARDASGREIDGARIAIDGVATTDHGAIALDPGAHVVTCEHASARSEEHVELREGERGRIVTMTIATTSPSAAPVRIAPIATSFAASPSSTPSPPWPTPSAPSSTPSPLSSAPTPSPPSSAPPPATPSPLPKLSELDDPQRRAPGVPASAWILGGVSAVALGGFAVFGAMGRSEEAHLDSTCAPHCSSRDADAVRTNYLVANVSLGVSVAALGAATWIFLSSRHADPPRVGVR